MFCVCDIDTAQYNWMKWIWCQHTVIPASFIYGKFRDNHNVLSDETSNSHSSTIGCWNDLILFFFHHRLRSQPLRIIRLDETEAKIISKRIKYTIIVHSKRKCIDTNSIDANEVDSSYLKFTVVTFCSCLSSFIPLNCTLIGLFRFHCLLFLKRNLTRKNIDFIKENVNNNNCVTHCSYAQKHNFIFSITLEFPPNVCSSVLTSENSNGNCLDFVRFSTTFVCWCGVYFPQLFRLVVCFFFLNRYHVNGNMCCDAAIIRLQKTIERDKQMNTCCCECVAEVLCGKIVYICSLVCHLI